MRFLFALSVFSLLFATRCTPSGDEDPVQISREDLQGVWKATEPTRLIKSGNITQPVDTTSLSVYHLQADSVFTVQNEYTFSGTVPSQTGRWVYDLNDQTISLTPPIDTSTVGYVYYRRHFMQVKSLSQDTLKVDYWIYVPWNDFTSPKLGRVFVRQ